MWLLLGVISALFIGVYDVCKKHAVRDNAVLPVLWLSVVSGAMMLLPLKIVSLANPEFLSGFGLCIETLAPIQHAAIFGKSLMISIAWIMAYSAIKHLPISIVTPIRASGPMWTILGAMLFFNEALNMWQWIGVAVVFSSYYLFSVVGRAEGIHFEKNKWVYFTLCATLLGTCSALYDKVLLQKVGLSAMAMMFWFAVYLVVILGFVTLLIWFPKRKKTHAFQFRASIIWIGILLVAADFAYFQALTKPEALLAILSVVRRSSVVVSFALGAILFSELNKRKKAAALAGVLFGVFVIMLSS